MTAICLDATLIKGHQVASGLGGDPRFPGGTIQSQIPYFRALGLELGDYYCGTLNLSIAPWQFKPRQARYRFAKLCWTEQAPAEDFSFFDCQLLITDQVIEGLVYYPHPETKPEHFQPTSVLEVLAPFIPNLAYGAELKLKLDDQQITLFQTPT